MRLLHGAAVVAVLLLGATLAQAQSLTDAAAKEKERRKSVNKPAKVVTDEDLRTGGGTVSNPASTDSTSTSGEAKPAEGQPGKEGATAKKEKSDDELRAEAQAAWRKKLDAANAELSQAQGLVSDLQGQLNDTSGGVYTPRRAGLTSQLDDARKRQSDAESKVAALTEEGRRNNWR